MKKLFLSLFLFFSSVFGMQFGQMGYQATSMAGTGVADFKSPFNLYYNPAGISHATFYKKVGGGLTLSLDGKQNKFLELTKISFKAEDLMKNPDVINKLEDIANNNYMVLNGNSGAFFRTPETGIGAFAFGVSLTTQTYAYVRPELTEVKIEKPLKDVNIGIDPSAAEVASAVVIEAPIGYSYTWYTKGGDISIGAAVKYMQVGFKAITADMSATDMTSKYKELLIFDMNDSQMTATVDLGFLYSVGPKGMDDLFTIGVVGKNLTAPSFDFKGHKIKIDPQARAGIGFHSGFWSLYSDIDLTENSMLLNPKYKERLVSVGTAFDFKIFSLRGGVSYDLINQDDIIYSIGTSVSVFDFSAQWGHKTNTIKGFKIPNYVLLQTGISFTF